MKKLSDFYEYLKYKTLEDASDCPCEDCFDEYYENVIKGSSEKLNETFLGSWGILWNGKLVDSLKGFDSKAEAELEKKKLQRVYPDSTIEVASPKVVDEKYKSKEICKDFFKV